MKWHLSYLICMSTQVILIYTSVSISKSNSSQYQSNRLSLDIMMFLDASNKHDGDLFAHWFSITLCKWPQFNTADLISLVLKADSTWDSTGGGMAPFGLLCINDWLMGHVADLETKGSCHSYFCTVTVKTFYNMSIIPYYPYQMHQVLKHWKRHLHCYSSWWIITYALMSSFY